MIEHEIREVSFEVYASTDANHLSNCKVIKVMGEQGNEIVEFASYEADDASTTVSDISYTSNSPAYDLEVSTRQKRKISMWSRLRDRTDWIVARLAMRRYRACCSFDGDFFVENIHTRQKFWFHPYHYEGNWVTAKCITPEGFAFYCDREYCQVSVRTVLVYVWFLDDDVTAETVDCAASYD